MAAAALPILAGTSLLQFAGGVSAGRIAKAESETQAKAIELGAVQREADRKSDLARAMASQIASAGSRGISAFEGSPLAILEADIKAEQEATERDRFSTQLASLTERTRGKVAKRQSLVGSGVTLGRDAYTMATLAPKED